MSGGAKTYIDQVLPENIWDALLGANNPSSGNVFATINDLGGGLESIFNSNRDYWLIENFDKGQLPQGWTQSTSGAPATVTYTSAYESGTIGQVNLNAPGPAALFSSVTFANGYNYLLNFSDCQYTKWNSRFKRTSTDVGVMLVGVANVAGSAVPSAFANVIALVHDPNNMTTANPGLTNNLFVWIKDASGQTLYNTGVAPSNAWQFVEFEYNYVNPLSPYVNVSIDGVLVVTVPGTDPNLFVSQAAGVGAGLKPVCYVGKTAAATGGNNLRVDNFNLLRKWA